MAGFAKGIVADVGFAGDPSGGLSNLPRADDSEWALPVREPEKTFATGSPYVQDGKPDPHAFRTMVALEKIAKTLDLIRLEISLINMQKDRIIR